MPQGPDDVCKGDGTWRTVDDLFDESEPWRETDANRAGEGVAQGYRELALLMTPVPGEWTREPPPPARYLLDWRDDHGQRHPLMRRGRVGLLSGAGGAGKTFALFDLIVAIATGKDWLGTFPVRDGKGKVLLAVAEEDTDVVRERLWAIIEARGLDAAERERVRANVVVLPLSGRMCALTKPERQGNDAITQFARDLEKLLGDQVEGDPGGWALIALDPLSRFAGPDAEVDNASATRVIQVLERLTQLPGRPCVVAAVHTNKASRSGGQGTAVDMSAVRGSTGFVDGARLVMSMSAALDERGNPMGTLVWIGVAKSNYGPRPNDAWLLTRSEGLGRGALNPTDGATRAKRSEIEAKSAPGGSGTTSQQRSRRLDIQEGNAETRRQEAETRRLKESRLRELGEKVST